MHREAIATLGATGLVGIAGAVSMSVGYPTVLRPLCLAVVVPAFYLLAFGPLPKALLCLLAPVPIAALFALWSLPLFRAQPRIPKRSIALFVVLVLIVILYFVVAWPYGVEYQKVKHTASVALINCGFVVALAWFLVRAYKSPSFRGSLLFHSLMFIWVAWYAFPWLGELP